MPNLLRWLFLLGFLAALTALGILCMNEYDVAIVQRVTSWTWLQHGDIGRTVNLCEAYGVFSMIVIFLIGLAILIPATRSEIPRIVVAMLLASGVTHILKLLIARERPHHFLAHLASLDADAAETTGNAIATAVHTSPWHGLLRFDLGLLNSVYSSFPSGHTTLAAVLTAMLWSLFPQTASRLYFAALLLLLGFQRVASQAHYPSDIFFGAVIGITVASLRHTPLWERVETRCVRFFVRPKTEVATLTEP